MLWWGLSVVVVVVAVVVGVNVVVSLCCILLIQRPVVSRGHARGPNLGMLAVVSHGSHWYRTHVACRYVALAVHDSKRPLWDRLISDGGRGRGKVL